MLKIREEIPARNETRTLLAKKQTLMKWASREDS